MLGEKKKIELWPVVKCYTFYGLSKQLHSSWSLLFILLFHGIQEEKVEKRQENLPWKSPTSGSPNVGILLPRVKQPNQQNAE